jgi:bifunctional enzyme CysN/CysC
MSHQADLASKDIHAYLEQHGRKDLLRFLTCGSVDDGKSTLIGRLLHDSKLIYEDQLAAVKADSRKFNTTGGEEVDLALLVDGLQAEREQGITIDVAYRYFSTSKRKFIIADTPGHEQYTRNMATGASTCDLAIILIDARSGVKVQTRRHTFIASLLGIRHLVVAVNKMDAVGWSENVFETIKADYESFADRLDVGDVVFIPLSALKGDNVVNPSPAMPWYKGATLMHHLENVSIASDRNLEDFRFPVQYVNRPNLDFRGYCGTIASGIVRKGDEVRVLPSGKTNRVKSIVTFEGERDEAFAPMAVTLTLEKEVDVSRGDMLVHPDNLPHVDERFEAMLVWMAEQPLVLGKQYLVKTASKLTNGRVSDLRFRVNVNTLDHEHANSLQLNEIAHVVVDLEQPAAFDAYKRNRGTGAFIVIDRLANTTVGAGMILEREAARRDAGVLGVLAETLQGYGRRHAPQVGAQERAGRLGQKPATVFLTGLAGAGKSSIAYALEKKLLDLGRPAHVLDGQSARLGQPVDVDFAPDASDALRRAAGIARVAGDAGLLTIAAFIAGRAADRAAFREIVGRERFLEVHLSAPPDVCRSRDRAGVWAKADQGLLRAFPGVGASYEAPEKADLVLDTASLGVDACVERLVGLLRARGFIA